MYALVCMYASMYVCIYACIIACIHTCINVCMYVCAYPKEFFDTTILEGPILDFGLCSQLIEGAEGNSLALDC